MAPLKLVNELLERFQPESTDEENVVKALRELVERQKFDPGAGKLNGPRMEITSVARNAGLSSRNLISYEGCALQRARDLVIEVLGLLKEYSLQIECDFLREENKRLQARLDKQDSILANRVVALHRKNKREAATPEQTWSPEEVLKSVRVKPMSELSSQSRSQVKSTP